MPRISSTGLKRRPQSLEADLSNINLKSHVTNISKIYNSCVRQHRSRPVTIALHWSIILDKIGRE